MLPFEADGLDRIYAPFEPAVAVERDRGGLAVPELGRAGSAPRPFHGFDGALLVPPAPPGAIDLASLPAGTGFVTVEEVEPATWTRLTGLPAPAGRAPYEAKTFGQPALAANLAQRRNELRGRGAVVLAQVRPWPMRVGERTLEAGASFSARTRPRCRACRSSSTATTAGGSTIRGAAAGCRRWSGGCRGRSGGYPASCDCRA